MGRGIEVFLLVLLAVLLFGAKRLPDAARGIAESLNVFKRSVKGPDEPHTPPAPPIRQITGEPESKREPERGPDAGA
jgi:sec-independent protein translocase protein TatA